MLKRNLRYSFSKGSPKLKLVSHLFILRYQKSEAPKIAVVAGKIVSKKAVLRNRAKRVFTETLVGELSKNNNSFDLVFFLRRPFVEYQKSAIIGELENSISKINK